MSIVNNKEKLMSMTLREFLDLERKVTVDAETTSAEYVDTHKYSISEVRIGSTDGTVTVDYTDNLHNHVYVRFKINEDFSLTLTYVSAHRGPRY